MDHKKERMLRRARLSTRKLGEKEAISGGGHTEGHGGGHVMAQEETRGRPAQRDGKKR